MSYYAELRVGLMYDGRPKSAAKAVAMAACAAGEIDDVGRHLGDVGVNVHNARLMTLEHVERFGLA